MQERTVDLSAAAGRRLAELRQAFDRSFAEAPVVATADRVDLLMVGIGANPFAIRLSDSAGLITDRRITPVPTAVPELRGVAGVRGAVIPVYDLALLLGFQQTTATRWLLLARSAAVAFVLDSFEGQLRIDADAIAPNDTASKAYIREIATMDNGSRPIVDLAAVVGALGDRVSGFKLKMEA